jgi:hypothetical protein
MFSAARSALYLLANDSPEAAILSLDLHARHRQLPGVLPTLARHRDNLPAGPTVQPVRCPPSGVNPRLPTSELVVRLGRVRVSNLPPRDSEAWRRAGLRFRCIIEKHRQWVLCGRVVDGSGSGWDEVERGSGGDQWLTVQAGLELAE